MRKSIILKCIRIIRKQVADFVIPSVTKFSFQKKPYLVLISCILSLRTKDKTTHEAAVRLFQEADTPQKMIRLPLGKIARLIYPVGFYRNKALVISAISKRLIGEFSGNVPGTQAELLKLKGVGLKTANLVLGLGFGVPAICVDTHVHRISNRLGWVHTQVPEETERALQSLIPEKYWIALNTILVTFGQNLCVPVSPLCSQCAVNSLCKRKGIKRSR